MKHSVLCIGLALVTATAFYTPFALGQPMPGSYSTASVKDPEVVMATNYAIQTQAKRTHTPLKLSSIESAEKQVVAGMNYRMTFKAKSGTKTQRARATVYKDLKGKYSLYDWTPLK